MKNRKKIRTISPDIVRDKDGFIDVPAIMKQFHTNPKLRDAAVAYGMVVEAAKEYKKGKS